MQHSGRREFLKSSSALLAASAGLMKGLAAVSPVRAEERKVSTEDLRWTSEMDELVRLIDSTPRKDAVPMMIRQLKRGVSFRQFLGAMFLVANRIKVSPHHVFMIHAAQRLSLDMSREECLLPLFWALDTLKFNRSEGTRYDPVKPIQIASAKRVEQVLLHAMDRFDSEQAESALIQLGRDIGPKQAMSRLWRYTARDDSYIGHRAIAMSNSWRVLNTIGWEHAEPVFQFVVRQLNGGRHRHLQERANRERSEKIGEGFPESWAGNRHDASATIELLDAMRTGDSASACEFAHEQLRTGKAQAASVWDAISLLGAEFMVRYYSSNGVGTTPLHTNTSANSLRFAFDTCGDRQVRLYTVLQAVAWATHFYGIQLERKRLRDISITEFPEVDVPRNDEQALKQIYGSQPKRRHDPTEERILSGYLGKREEMDHVAQLMFSYAKRQPDHVALISSIRRMTVTKATLNAHDVKFPSAILANYRLVHPRWRPHLLASIPHYMHGSQAPDNPAVKAAVKELGDS